MPAIYCKTLTTDMTNTIRAIPFIQAHAHQTARAKPVMPIKACTKTSVPASIRQTKKSTTIYLPNISWTI